MVKLHERLASFPNELSLLTNLQLLQLDNNQLTELPESIGNIAKKHPEKVEKAIPYLFKNTVENEDNSTVIRWCSAYALSEIAKASKKKEIDR